MPKTPHETGRLSRESMIAYSSMSLSPAIFMIGVTFMLPQLYAKELGIRLADLGLALLAIRIFDTIADQAAGYLSDRTRTRFGARKPWVVAGIVTNTIACYFLFTPPAGAGLGYLVLWRIVYDIGWTIYFIPYTAWGAELTTDYGDRSRLNGYSGTSSAIGTVLKNVAPIALFWFGVTSTTAYSIEMYHRLFWVCLPMLVVLTGFSALRTPDGVMVARRPGLDGLWRSLKANRPFWIYLVGFFFANLGLGLNGLLFTFYDSYLKLGAWYPYLMMGYASITIISIPLWVRVASRWGKHRAYAISTVASALVLQAFWLIDPAQDSETTVLILTALVLAGSSMSTACLLVSPAAMLADVVDYGTWRSGSAMAGSYFAFYSIVSKITIALGGSAGFILLGMIGYNVSPGAANTASAIFGLRGVVLVLPAVMGLIGAAILWRFPIDRRRHGIIGRRLANRAQRSVTQPSPENRAPT